MPGASAQYAIDIAARMTGGEYTSAQLDSLTANLAGSGKGAAHFQDAIQQIGDKLLAAKASVEGANGALAVASTEYGNLQRAALQAAKAAERAALKNAGVVPDALAAKASEASGALSAQASVLKTLEANADKAAAEEASLVNTMGNLRKMGAHVDKSLTGNAERAAKLQGALGQLGGPVGVLGQRVISPVKGFRDLQQVLGTSRAAALVAGVGVAALVAVVIALSVAVAAGVVKVAAWAISLSDASRSAALTSEAMQAMHPELIALSPVIKQLAADTGMHADELQEYAGRLREAKVSASELPAALRAVALYEAALGKGSSGDFFEQLKSGKQTVAALAQEVETKLGGIVARQMLGLEMQGARLRSNFSKLFGALEIEGALGGIARVVGLFDETTAAGDSVKTLFGKMFQPLADGVNTASLVLEAFALGVLIGLTKVYLFVKPLIAVFSEWFGLSDSSLATVLHGITKAAQFLAPVIALVAAGFVAFAAVVGVLVGVVGFSIGLIAAGVALLIAAVVAPIAGLVYLIQNWSAVWSSVGAAISGVAATVGSAISGAFGAALDYLRTIDWLMIGANMIMGLVSGITGSAGKVIEAISGAVGGAVTAAKRMLGIASPSKVFEGIGDYSGEGLVQGLEGKSQAVDQAMTAMVEPPPSMLSAQDSLEGNFGSAVAAAPTTQAAPQAVPSAPAGSGLLAGATFIFNGVEGAENAEVRFGELLTRVLEGDVAQIGGELVSA